jgi:peptidoglycan/xylan/chitin deacetylase (PgdA/CDA1 family)
MLTILEFHNISKQGVVWTKVRPKRFREILDILEAETEVISPVHYERYVEDRKEGERPCVMISFDDGYEEIYTNAYPMLRERGLAGMVSVVAGFTGRRNLWDIMGGELRHLDWNETEELLSSGWGVCSHTMTHPDLKLCSDDRLRWELEESKAVLERRLGIEVPAVAYPFGRFNARVLAAAKKTGYRIGFTVGAEIWRGVRGPLTTIRVPVYQLDCDALVRAKVKPDGFLKWLDSLKNRSFNKASLVTSFFHRRRYKGIPGLTTR